MKDPARLVRVQCAAITRGCMNGLVMRDMLDEELLRLNGWRLDHGRWICGDHDRVDTERILVPQ